MLLTRKMLVVCTTLILTSLVVVNASLVKYALAESSETWQRDVFHKACLEVIAIAPNYVNAGENFNLTLIFYADENLSDIKFSLELTTFSNDTEFSFQKIPVQTIPELLEENEQTFTFNVDVPSNASRVVQGRINCTWNIRTGEPYPVTYAYGFDVAIIADPWREIAEQLEKELNATKTERDYWKGEYERLNATYTEELGKLQGEVGTTRQLAVIFGITTVFFVITTFYLFKRRPSEVW